MHRIVSYRLITTQRSVATDLVLLAVDQCSNITTFPAGAVVFCTLRYPSEKDAPYSSDGYDVLPTLKHSTERGVQGHMDHTRRGCGCHEYATPLLYTTLLTLSIYIITTVQPLIKRLCPSPLTNFIHDDTLSSCTMRTLFCTALQCNA